MTIGSSDGAACDRFKRSVSDEVLHDWRFAWQALAASCKAIIQGKVTPAKLVWQEDLIVKLQRNYESTLRTAEIFAVDLAGPFHELPAKDREEVLFVLRRVRLAEAVKRAATAKG